MPDTKLPASPRAFRGLLSRFLPIQLLLVVALSLAVPLSARADRESARLNMEDTENPLVLMETSEGDFYVELFPEEAPRNVAHFLTLAVAGPASGNPGGEAAPPESPADRDNTGSAEPTRIADEDEAEESGADGFYSNLLFHRVIPGLLIQSGSALHSGRAETETQVPQEINAEHLGLDLIPLLDQEGKPHSWMNLADVRDFQLQVLVPLYQRLAIDSLEEVRRREEEITTALENLSLMQAYENLGYRYRDDIVSRPPRRGSLAMAAESPAANGSQFFISLSDADWLQGRHTVIGHIVEGMEVAERIGRREIDGRVSTELAPLLHAVRRLGDPAEIQ